MASHQRLEHNTVTRVVIAGGTGLIGRALMRSLLHDGIEVVVLTRNPGRRGRSVPSGARVEPWDPKDPTGVAELARVIGGSDAVVNLCGVPIGPLPWTAGRRRAILESRVQPSAHLIAAMALLEPNARPGVFVCASGTDGYTGLDTTPATEATDTDVTPGFLADVGRAWESTAETAAVLGIRVAMIRTAFVLARDSGLMQLLALPVRLGLGGRYGSGEQWFSWIHLDDLVSAYRLAIVDDRIRGPVIAASPQPSRQRDVAAGLGRALHRPIWFPTPAWLLRLLLREESTLLLGSRRVAPTRLLAAGFSFAHTDLHDALQDVLRGKE